MDNAPVRLCCGRAHRDAACPDGKVMCSLCFDRFEQDELYRDEEGAWDICQECKDHEDERRKAIERGDCSCKQNEKKGICRHVIPFLKKDDIEASEDYL